MNIEYRYAEPKDVDQVQELFGGFYFYHKKDLLDTIRKQRIIVSVLGDKVLGLLNIGAKYDKILMLIVLKEYRGKGIARKLFNFAQILYKTGTITIDATEESIIFWETVGFKKTGLFKETKTRKLTNMIYS